MILELLGVEVEIRPFSSQQLLMLARLDDLSVANNQNLVGIEDSAETVSNRKRCSSLH